MSNAAKLAIPVSGDNGKVPAYNSATDAWDLLAIQSFDLLGWTQAQAWRLVSATRDGNGAITTASVVWPDGATGTFTTDTASTTFPGAIDAFHVTHVLGTTATVTQPAVTRDPSTGAVTAQPALVVT